MQEKHAALQAGYRSCSTQVVVLEAAGTLKAAGSLKAADMSETTELHSAKTVLQADVRVAYLPL